MAEIICVGEALVDFISTQRGTSLEEAPGFLKMPGGAPANLAVGLARLGERPRFIGKVGDDPFGRFLRQVLENNRVNTEGLLVETRARTGLAFVSLSPSGERDFVFYRHPAADMLLAPEEISLSWLEKAGAICFGSLSLSTEPSRSAIYRLLEAGRARGLVLAVDVNLRLGVWPSPEVARREIWEALAPVDLVKLNAPELAFLTGEGDVGQGARRLLASGASLVVVTLGEAGAFYVTPGGEGRVPGYRVEVVDTTGAGDAFMAGLMAGLAGLAGEGARGWLERLTALPREEFRTILAMANAAGALCVTRPGAMTSLPTRDQLVDFLHRAARSIDGRGGID